MTSPLGAPRTIIKRLAHKLAGWLDRVTNSKITPNQVTTLALILHLPIMYAIVAHQFTLAALMLIAFGLLDTLDGSLARLQNRVTKWGMVYDSVSDRIKESGIYLSLLYIFLRDGHIQAGLVVATLIAASIIVSYINAAGDMARKSGKATDTNRAFRGGIMKYEYRILGIVIALFTQQFLYTFSIVLALTVITILQRFRMVYLTFDHDKS